MATLTWPFEEKITLAEAARRLRLSQRQVMRLGLESEYDPHTLPRVWYSAAQVEHVRAEREKRRAVHPQQLLNARRRAWRRLAAKYPAEMDLLLQQELIREMSVPAGPGTAHTTTTDDPQQRSQACPV